MARVIPTVASDPKYNIWLQMLITAGIAPFAAIDIIREPDPQQKLRKLIALGVPAAKAAEMVEKMAPGSVKKAAGGLDKAIPGGIPGAGTLTDVAGFVSALTQRNTWLRVGEGVLGLLLIGIGVAALTRGTAVGSAIRKGVKTGASVVPAGKVAKGIK